MTTFIFQILSPKYGTVTVTAPERFRTQIEARTWCVRRCPTKAAGAQFYVVTDIPRPGGGRDKRGRARRLGLGLHRFIWQLAGLPPVKAIDHIDGQPLNNAEDNLRDGTERNAQNTPKRRDNSSGAIGVGPSAGRYRARIMINGQPQYLGLFDSIQEAQHARDIAALKLHGDFAVLNQPANNNCLVPISPAEYLAILTLVSASA